MKRYFELFFRHPLLFSLPPLVALVAGVAYGMKAPPSYIAKASVFCDNPLPFASTLQQPTTPGVITPCADKATVLQEFLQTGTFDTNVARLVMQRQRLGYVDPSSIGHAVTASAPGPQILTLSVKAPTPALAAGTAQAVIDEFIAEVGADLQQRAQALVSTSKAQLDSASTALANAKAALASYLLTNPLNAADLQETTLNDAVTLAQQQRDAAETAYNQAQLAPTRVEPTSFHIVDSPVQPTAPVSHKKQLVLSAAGGLLGGTVITILALVVLMAQDRSVREEQDLEPTLEVIGSIPQFAKEVLSPTGPRPDGQPKKGFWTPPGLVESCRLVLRHLERKEHRVRSLEGVATRTSPFGTMGATDSGRPSLAPAPQNAKDSIAVTSCLRGEGRSTVAAGLAAASCQAYGLTVILVELDLEHPSYARQFGMDSSPGIAEILRDSTPITECLHMTNDDSVRVLVAGDTGEDPAKLFASLRASSLINDLGDLCDVVIADLPPASPDGEASSLSHLFNSVLLVVRTGTAPVTEIRRALDDLGKLPLVVLNGVESSLPRPLRALLAG